MSVQSRKETGKTFLASKRRDCGDYCLPKVSKTENSLRARGRVLGTQATLLMRAVIGTEFRAVSAYFTKNNTGNLYKALPRL